MQILELLYCFCCVYVTRAFTFDEISTKVGMLLVKQVTTNHSVRLFLARFRARFH